MEANLQKSIILSHPAIAFEEKAVLSPLPPKVSLELSSLPPSQIKSDIFCPLCSGGSKGYLCRETPQGAGMRFGQSQHRLHGFGWLRSPLRPHVFGVTQTSMFATLTPHRVKQCAFLQKLWLPSLEKTGALVISPAYPLTVILEVWRCGRLASQHPTSPHLFLSLSIYSF